VLQRLERADLPTELLAHLRVLDRQLDGLPGAAEAVGRDADAGDVEETREDGPALALAPDERRLGNERVLQVELAHATGQIEPVLRLHAGALRAALDQEERHAGLRRAGLRAGRDEEDVGAGRVLHEELRAGEEPSVLRALGGRLD